VTRVDTVGGECAGERVALDNDLGIGAVLTIVGRPSEIGAPSLASLPTRWTSFTVAVFAVSTELTRFRT